jgi:MoaA/NifB/PqqE/SkfB family radical SAM enzyme
MTTSKPVESDDDKFCILPWIHLNIQGKGVARMCCFASDKINAEGKPLTLYSNSVDEVWNSTYMREMRKAMSEGQRVAQCDMCHQNEARLGRSGRTNYNGTWLPRMQLSVEQIKQQSIATGHVVTSRPIFYQLEIGNACNLACRMCSAEYSSKIAGDKVHSRWSPEFSGIRDSKLRVEHRADLSRLPFLPVPVFGIQYQGLLDDDQQTGERVWSSASCSIAIDRIRDAELLDALYLRIGADRCAELPLVLSLNGQKILEGVPDAGVWETEIDLAGVDVSGGLRIGISTRADDADDLGRGLPIEEMAFVYKPDSNGRRPVRNAFSRFSSDDPWHDQAAAIYGEILKDPHHLRELYFTGGEPFAVRKLPEMLEYLIDLGAAPQITLSFSSNATIANEALLQALAAFSQVNLWLSLDGTGPVYEYIRYPGRWEQIEENLGYLGQLRNANIVVTPVVQLFNILTITDLFRFCDSKGLPFYVSRNYNPKTLTIEMLPECGRRLAAGRLAAYLPECRPHLRPQVEALIGDLTRTRELLAPETFNNLVLFTNDLDASRGQSIHETLPELVALFEEAGFSWGDGRRFRHYRLESGAVQP